MNYNEIDPRKVAERISLYAPVSPLQIIVEPQFSAIQELLFSVQDVTAAQKYLDVSIALGNNARVDPGIKAQVVYWDGIDGIVIGCNSDGKQVGFGQVKWTPDPQGREKQGGLMSYDTAYVVSSLYQGQGLGSAMMDLLENHVAFNNKGIGAGFFYTITAETPESKVAAQKMIERTGAVVAHLPGYYRRLAVKKEFYHGARPGVTVIQHDKIITQTHY